ncbi:MAG: hypothetical protein JWQ29_1216, partial [Phenylobacterium sp.]|nr:hypothetical protein [Phenylobacterium sp.]
MIGRRKLFQQAAAGLVGLPVMASAAAAKPAAQSDGDAAQLARNKQVITDNHLRQQRGALPPTLPGETLPPSPPPFIGQVHFSNMGWPGGKPELVNKLVGPWHVQSCGPPIHSYGPFIAEGDWVVEEWETYFRGLDRTTYSNHYVMAYQIKDGQLVRNHEYVDSLHALVVLGQHAPWPVPEPSRTPRRRRQAGPGTTTEPTLEMETIFPIRQEFNLDPALLRDVIATANPPKRFPDTVEGNKAVVQAMRDAQAKGDMAAVAAYHGHGFRHFIAGEGPFGWEHLPIEDLYAPLVKHLASPLKVRFSPMVSEHGAVFEQMDSLATLDDGTVYNNWHCFIHEVRGGVIVQTREYMDTE